MIITRKHTHRAHTPHLERRRKIYRIISFHLCGENFLQYDFIKQFDIFDNPDACLQHALQLLAYMTTYVRMQMQMHRKHVHDFDYFSVLLLTHSFPASFFFFAVSYFTSTNFSHAFYFSFMFLLANFFLLLFFFYHFFFSVEFIHFNLMEIGC